MYALLHSITNQLLGVFDTKFKAVTMARVISDTGGTPVTCIYNKPAGETAICFRFEGGQQTFDGGCCPSPWAVAALQSLKH